MEKMLTIIWEFYKIVKSQVSAAMAQSVERILGKEYRDEKWVSRNPSKFGKKLHLLIWLSR